MFYVRLNKIKIFNNREFIGKAEVEFISFINHSESSFPILEEFFNTNDPKEKKELLNKAIEKVISSRRITPIHKIKDNHELFFGYTGYIVYEAKKIPEDFSWMLMGIELDSKSRNTGELIRSALQKAEKTDFVSSIANLVNVSNPILEAGIQILSLISNIMINKKDDQIGVFLTSFIRILDYPHGKRDKKNVPDLTNNMHIDYTIFGYEK